MKKLLSVILISVFVLSLCSCGGGSSVTLTQLCDDDETVKATVSVGYGNGTVIDESTNTNEDESLLVNEAKDFSVELYLYFDDTYESFKEDASSEEGYKEIKYSGFDGYMYLYDDYEYEICLKLADEMDNQVFLFAYVAPAGELIDTETTDMEKIFGQKEVQDILNSIKYKGIKEIKGE